MELLALIIVLEFHTTEEYSEETTERLLEELLLVLRRWMGW